MTAPEPRPGPDAEVAVLVLGDVLAACADDLGVPLRSRDVRRLAARMHELLLLTGWVLLLNPDTAAGCDDGQR